MLLLGFIKTLLDYLIPEAQAYLLRFLNIKDIHNNFFNLRIMGLQALAIPKVYKLCYNYPNTLRSW